MNDSVINVELNKLRNSDKKWKPGVYTMQTVERFFKVLCMVSIIEKITPIVELEGEEIVQKNVVKA